MRKYFFQLLLILFCLFLFGCDEQQIMLSKLKDSEWYKTCVVWADSINKGPLRLQTGQIWVGQIHEIRYDRPGKKLSDVILTPSWCLKSYSSSDCGSYSDPVRFFAEEKDFRTDNMPKVGEYWAFGAVKGMKGQYDIIASAELIYDKDTESLKINDSKGQKLEPNFTLFVSNQSLTGALVPLKIAIDGKLIVDQKISKDAHMIQHTYYSFPLTLAEGKHRIKIWNSSVEEGHEFSVDPKHDILIVYYNYYPWHKFKRDKISLKLRKGPLLIR